LLRHALGEPVEGWAREAGASGVDDDSHSPARRSSGVSGIDAARALPNIEDLHITAKPHIKCSSPCRRGRAISASFFREGAGPPTCERALRAAHGAARLH